jgi:hypothetical protein
VYRAIAIAGISTALGYSVPNCDLWQQPDKRLDAIFSDNGVKSITNLKMQLSLSRKFYVGFLNASGTGYIWDSNVMKADVLSIDKINPIRASCLSGDVVGYEIIDVFVISPNKVGSTDVVFTLARPQSERLRSFNVSVTITE